MRLGIDLGGTKIEAVGLGRDGTEHGRIRIATPAGDYDATVAAVAGLVADAEREWGSAASVGVGTPGAIDPVSGLLKNSNSTVLNGRTLALDLEVALGRPVRLANDADCLALSESRDGAAEGADPVFAVILGTGVGGGIVANQWLVRGPNAIAGEWGHTPFPAAAEDPVPPQRCWCGKEGCVETYLSGAGLSVLHEARTGRKAGALEISLAADRGDRDAAASIGQYVQRVGKALAGVINLLDPEVIVLGGGLSNINRLYDGVPSAWAPHVFSAEVRTRLAKARHGDSSGARGAARLWEDSG